MFAFNDFLHRIDFDPKNVRLLRHDQRGVAAWRRGRKIAFGCFASFQTKTYSPFAGTDLACHFLPGPTLDGGVATALFIGTTRINDRWGWDGSRRPAIVDEKIIESEPCNRDIEAYDLEWLDAGQDYVERILIRWGPGTKAWSQWANKNPKEILELRLRAREPDFPGFYAFHSRISEIPSFPQAWIAALEEVKGIYLLVTDDGEQYVGSASGTGGFIGRWRDYLANGHGGNVLLRKRGKHDYTVSILEIASPDMSTSEIIAREYFWMKKLGARAHGLNAN